MAAAFVPEHPPEPRVQFPHALTELSGLLDLEFDVQHEQPGGEDRRRTGAGPEATARRVDGFEQRRVRRGTRSDGLERRVQDHVLGSVVGYGVSVGAKVDAHRHVKAWLEDFQGRPSAKAMMKS